jgi:hypothetical protein
MNRLHSELQRLYLLPTTDAAGSAQAAAVRALVLELARPAEWGELSKVWRGVQADLALPPPAIAVSGTDGLQLWFSLAEPVSASEGADFLARVRARYLAHIAPERLRVWPSAADPLRSPAPVPALHEATGNWSAFVAPDLAPVFADTPWLDIPPGEDGQADVLARLESIKPAALAAAMQRLQPLAPQEAPRAMPGTADAPDLDPARFLQQVLNDASVPLGLRIEAAKALLSRPVRPPLTQ